MVSPLIFLLLIHQTWAPWRPTSISLLIISLKSDTYYTEISVIKLEGREKKTLLFENFIGLFPPEELGKSCRCALRRCFFKLFLSQTLLYLQCSSVTLSRPSKHTITSSDIEAYSRWAVSPCDSARNCNQIHCICAHIFAYGQGYFQLICIINCPVWSLHSVEKHFKDSLIQR